MLIATEDCRVKARVSSFIDFIMKADINVLFCLLPVAIFDFTFFLASDNVVTSPVVLHDPENMGIIAAGILMLLCIQTKIFVF